MTLKGAKGNTMEFKVKRFTCFYTGDNKPCHEAFPGEKKGQWKVEFKSLEELCAFIQKYNCIVISKDKGQLTLDICSNHFAK